MPGFLVEEEVFDGHYRVVKILSGENIVYSIDYYARLETAPPCEVVLEAGSSPARLCYHRLSSDCEAVIVETPGRVELVNLRLYAQAGRDPAGGVLGEARRICLEKARSLVEAYGVRGSAPS